MYDEAKEGVKFSSLPVDWICPVCGAPKDVFILLAEKPAEIRVGTTVSDILVDQIADWGVKYVFGIPGTSTLGVVDAIRKNNKVKYIQVRHEQTAAFMASAYGKLTGNKKWASPYYTDYRPEIVRWHEDCYAITDALGLCAFSTTLAYGVNPKNMAEMFSAATGIEIDEKGIMLAGRRIVTIEKSFNVREGADRKMDDLPYRLMHDPAPSGPAKGFMNSPEELNGMLDKYYELHEWDLKTSWPYRRTLDKLNLSYVADGLEKWVKLPQ